jgi:hypothetical protein
MVYRGRLPGDWRKVKGNTGIYYWRLEAEVPEDAAPELVVGEI